jgi:hypothetical protein
MSYWLYTSVCLHIILVLTFHQEQTPLHLLFYSTIRCGTLKRLVFFVFSSSLIKL